MIYSILKLIVRATFRLFYKQKVKESVDLIPTDGPLIVLGNHPNTLIDPLLVASQIKRRVGFLANASIFVNPLVNRILKYFWVIPVYRKKDVKPGEKRDNSKAFEACDKFLENNGALLIFPEGTSVNELKLREIKTGTARIALNFESGKQFNGGLKIAIMAIHYSDSLRFRSSVYLQCNGIIDISDYKDQYEKDPNDAIQGMTSDIRMMFEGVLTHVESKTQEELLVQTLRFYSEYIDDSKHLFSDSSASFKLRKELSLKILDLEKEDPNQYEQFQFKMTQYFELLSFARLGPAYFKEDFIKMPKFLVLFSYVIQILLFFPFALLGVITNYIPYKIPVLIYKSLKIDEEYRSTVLMMSSMLIFPLYYIFNYYLLVKYGMEGWGIRLSLLLLFALMGYFALFYDRLIGRLKKVIRYYSMKESKRNEIMDLKGELVEDISTFLKI